MAGPALAEATWPVRTKMPAPMMAPTPRLIRLMGPSERFSSLLAASFWMLAMDFFRKFCFRVARRLRTLRLAPPKADDPRRRN